MAQISGQSPLPVRLLEDRSRSRDNKTLILDMSPKEEKQLLLKNGIHCVTAASPPTFCQWRGDCGTGLIA